MTTTATKSFTRTNAGYIASKVAGDLRQMQAFYGKPTDVQIDSYVTELVEHLVAGFVSSVEYGFKRDGAWIVSLRYDVRDDGTVGDTNAGRVYAHADVAGVGFYSYLVKTSAYWSADESTKSAFIGRLPFEREGADEPAHTNGVWEDGKSYSSGGVGAVRRQWRPV